MEHFKERLRAARTRAGMTQKALADAVKAHPNTISDLETGRNYPTLKLGCRIANILRVNVLWLAGETAEVSQNIQLTAQESANYAAYRQLSPKEQQQFADFMTDYLKATQQTQKS